jgi:hypothetical protein
MRRPRRVPRRTAIALVLLAVLFGLMRAAALPAGHAWPGGAAERDVAAGRAHHRVVSARTLAATRPAVSGPCSIPGIGDIGGLLGFCSLGQAGLIGGLNNLCNPGVPQPESATAGVNALVKPPAAAGKPVATPYNQYGMAGQFWAPYDLQCSDMTALIGNDVAGMIFDFAKSLDRLTITVYQSAAGEGILGWLQGVTDRLISGLGNAIYFPYVAVVVIVAAIWLAWQGLIRKRGTRTIEGTIWMVIACAAAIWLIGRPAEFTGLGKGVSDGISTALNTAFANLPSPGQPSCLPVTGHDPQISRSSFSYTSGRTVVDQNANELWTVLVCKPWLDGEFGTTALSVNGKPTPTATYGRQLLFAQAIAVNEHATAAVVSAKQAVYVGIAQTIKTNDATSYPLFQGKQWTTRLEIAFSALIAAVVAGVLVLLISVTLILLKLGFLLLLIVGPFFLLIGIHPGFGRVVAMRWFEMLVGVLLKQAAVALALSILLYCYALIMGTTDAVLPWALKILMITLVTVAVFIYRKPFQHLFSAVGYGALGATDRAEADLSRAAASARANTATAALAVPGVAAYRAARWARRNPAQVAGLALSAATAGSTAGLATGAVAGADAAAGAGEHAVAGQGQAAAAAATSALPDVATGGAQGGTAARARAWGASAGTASASKAPPLRLPASKPGAAAWPNITPSGGTTASTRARPAAGAGGGTGNGSSAPPLPPAVKSAGAAPRQGAVPPVWPGTPSRLSAGGAAPPRTGRSASSRRPAPPPTGAGWPGKAAASPRSGAAPPARKATRPAAEPARPRPAGSPGQARRWFRTSQNTQAARDGGRGRERPPDRPGRGQAESGGPPGDQDFSIAPYGLRSGSSDEPAGPFWSRPIWRRK